MELIIKASEKEIAGLVLALQDRPESPSQLFRKVYRLMEEYRQKNGEAVQNVRFCTEKQLFVLSRKEGRTTLTVTVPDGRG